ncbi:uncharacterized protein LOC129779277 [Toxorhynchites rutilus septentrionalis]|uniref:uncharacterized protein LOC129779277 n=1 Tax=Toxorhynchites rutilus septentrionalis TaxID=329112 RepID=UPI00247A57BD|nr:uncharacterized protein LOC129779277 [Toxorhynchites rutilus septentrionalis]XP_055642649.1 uncharacterized protein LOC129779277 [Toxorhynchites rutilus septentrionalis]
MSLDNSVDEEYNSSIGEAESMGSLKRIKLEGDLDNNNTNGSFGELLRSIKSGLDMRVRGEECGVIGREGGATAAAVAGSSSSGVGDRIGGGIYGGGGSGCGLNNNNNSDAFNNNNSIKAKLGDVDEVKFGEFSKFLADSEKDENMATVLELLHENYGLIQRYASGYDCSNEKCQHENLHEHFHCYDTFCRGKVLYKKYEIIRHLKWHKKRKESLKYGFYRFSSSDDCSIQYGQCQHNHKHTHYHCVHESCDKVYISTSDVQMHANYHRKHEAIVKNGFQRFRATEECNTDHCAFKAQKTTHFHCRRENCKYTFKNKADMEKHKTYHLKHETLLREGYKKFLKSEDCTYQNCRFSRVCNHIHCMHENCHYVLHSSGQLLSHKRKHERMDTEVDYRRFQMAKNLLNKFNMYNRSAEVPAGDKDEEEPPKSPSVDESARHPMLALLTVMSELTFRSLPLQMMLHMRMQMLQNMSYEQVLAAENAESLKRLTESGLGEEYFEQLYKFNEQMCHLNERAMMDANSAISESSMPRNINGSHNDQSPLKRKLEDGEPGPSVVNQGLPLFFPKDVTSPPLKSKLLSNPSIDYRLLKKDDSGLGDSSSEASASQTDRQKAANFLQFSSSKTLFNRKRGRPRKNHVMEVYNNVQDSPQAIFTSFKLEKNDSKQVEHQKEHPVETQSEPKFGKDPHANNEDNGRGRKFSGAISPPSRMFFPLEPASMPLLGAPDFGGFSQILEKHMREIKIEPSATVTHEPEPSGREKLRNQLKCVVCHKLFETFADIKEHECLAKEPEKPLLAFPPGTLALLHHHPAAIFRGQTYQTEVEPSRLMYQPQTAAAAASVGLPPTAATKESLSLVKTTGTYFPDVNANKLKYY